MSLLYLVIFNFTRYDIYKLHSIYFHRKGGKWIVQEFIKYKNDLQKKYDSKYRLEPTPIIVALITTIGAVIVALIK